MFNFDVNQILGMLSQQGYTGGLLGQQQQQQEYVPPQADPTRPLGQFGRQAMQGANVTNPYLFNTTFQVPQRPAMNPLPFYRRPDFGGMFGGAQGGGVGAPTVPTPGIKRDPSSPVVY